MHLCAVKSIQSNLQGAFILHLLCFCFGSGCHHLPSLCWDVLFVSSARLPCAGMYCLCHQHDFLVLGCIVCAISTTSLCWDVLFVLTARLSCAGMYCLCHQHDFLVLECIVCVISTTLPCAGMYCLCCQHDSSLCCVSVLSSQLIFVL